MRNGRTQLWTAKTALSYVEEFRTGSSISTMTNNQTEDIRICYVNCQSLFAHINKFSSFFINSGYHIICLSKTWLKPIMSDHMVSLRDYYLLRNDRNKRAKQLVEWLSTSENIYESKHYDNQTMLIVANRSIF